jgi:hypothetical protein
MIFIRLRKNKLHVIASDPFAVLRAGSGSEAPASPRQLQLLQSAGRGGAISFFSSETRDCFVASLLAMTIPD